MRQPFQSTRAFLPVIHVLDKFQALNETEKLVQCDVDGIFLINMSPYNLPAEDLLTIYQQIRSIYPDLWVGLNFLDKNVQDEVFNLLPSNVNGYWSDFSGVDLTNCYYAKEIQKNRFKHQFSGLYFGGVAFKYQTSVHDDDLTLIGKNASQYMDVVTTSGEQTGYPPTVEKIRRLKMGIENRAKLAIASGITPENVKNYPYADAFLVATGICHSFYSFDVLKVKTMRENIDSMEILSEGEGKNGRAESTIVS